VANQAYYLEGLRHVTAVVWTKWSEMWTAVMWYHYHYSAPYDAMLNQKSSFILGQPLKRWSETITGHLA
jgi:hypothetical protein